jgi:acyl-CoA thioesterase FadM
VGRVGLGVDVVSVETRSDDAWLSLLGQSKAELRAIVSASGVLPNDAGAMVWAVFEAAFKALGSTALTLELERSKDAYVAFRAWAEGKSCRVVAAPVVLTRGPRRIVALAQRDVVEELAPPPEESPPAHLSTGTPEPVSPAVNADAGPQGQPVLTVPLKLGFAEANSVGRNVHFAQFWSFMGRVREQAIEPLLPVLAETLADGKHAWLTNFVEARFFRTTSVGDPLEARFWLERVSGPGQSSLAFVFDFGIATERGRERVALARMQTSWVDVSADGTFRPSPHPAAFAAFVEQQRPQVAVPDESSWPARADARGDVLWRAPAGPSGARRVDELTLDTGPEDANFVGNVYFSAYARWQGRLRDRFLYATVGTPERLGELDCRRVRVEHLREAMPFDRVLVRMLVSRVLTRGVDLRFEYFRLESDGGKSKLAVSEHEAAWLVDGAEAELPDKLRKALLPEAQAVLAPNEA